MSANEIKVNHQWENVCPDESTRFSGRRSYSVEPASDTCGAGLCGEKTEIIAQTEFAEHEKHAIYDDKTGDVFRKLSVA
jgi:hypothetical protein